MFDPISVYGKLYEDILSYNAFNAQEEVEKEVLCKYMQSFPDLLTRQNPFAHLTASAWIVNLQGTKVLMAYHKIYDSWAWTGGHADGNSDLLEVAIKEAEEETGICNLHPLNGEICALDILPVWAHKKNGVCIASHLHLNLSYIMEADDSLHLQCKPDENSGVQWVDIAKVNSYCTEREMKPVYQKLNDRFFAYAVI